MKQVQLLFRVLNDYDIAVEPLKNEIASKYLLFQLNQNYYVEV